MKEDLKKVPEDVVKTAGEKLIKDTDKPLKETETKEIAKRLVPEKDEYTLEVIRDYDGAVDPFYLPKKDPKYEYHFLRISDRNLFNRTGNLLLSGQGWQICPRVHCIQIGVPEELLAADGTYRVHDVILGRIPVELYKEKLVHKQKRADAPMKTIERMLKKGDPDNPDTKMHDSMSGLQTAKDLRMK